METIFIVVLTALLGWSVEAIADAVLNWVTYRLRRNQESKEQDSKRDV